MGFALEFLFDNGVMLRNLEANGILMSENTKLTDGNWENLHARISRIDKAIVTGYEEVTSGVFGDIRYRAPEVIKGKTYNFKADAWSFGVILYLVLG